jgi:hypothetical protein
MTNISMHTDVQWRSTRSQAQPDQCKGLTHKRTHNQHANMSAKARGYQSTYLSASITFSTRSATYKKQGAPDQYSIPLLLLSVHATPCTKSKELPIDAPYSLYYFQHAQRRVQKVRGYRSTLHIASTTFHTHLLSRIKPRGPIGMCSRFSI